MKTFRFYLLGYKGLKILQALSKEEISLIDDVVIAKDRAVINDYSQEIEDFCKKINLRYYFRNNEPNSQSDYLIAIGWRWLLKTIRNNIIVFHDSLLPRLRGFNPLVTALINGDTEIGATVLLANKEFDRGPILCQKAIQIQYPIKIKDAIELVAEIYAEMIKEVIFNIRENSLVFKEQIEEHATYSLWRDEEDYRINWNWDAIKIKRFIDSIGKPYRGAKTIIEEKEVRIFDAEIVQDVNIENRVPGKVLFKDNDGLTITCGNGLVKIKNFYLDEKLLLDYSKLFRLRFQ
ncbi:methionyl-tRNA formyltransferase [Draconibacterium sediminis]|uniref:methionyl-tRNA formyltransferase n=1 Tax=Draconibacterium sediminis TaxID=1544798 RepID=UPI0026ED16A5|nr:formyltransferase family protein [Draconibacterium sediminis]